MFNAGESMSNIEDDGEPQTPNNVILNFGSFPALENREVASHVPQQ